MNFGQLLNKARQANGLNLSDVAKATGIAPTNLHRMETGARPPPAPEKIESIMRAVQMDARSSALLLWLVGHEMPEVLAHLALQDRSLALEDCESAALMRWVHVSPEKLSKETWLRVVHHICQAREGAEREASLTVARDWPEIKKGKS